MNGLYFKIDFHTHSILSRDGGINKDKYKKILESKKLDYIAITDHNEIDFAKQMHLELGERIIVGEEISTQEGHIIGLFLQEKIEKGLPLLKTISEIKKQNGLVYIPHPFAKLRHGLGLESLEKISNHIDILETFNGRNFFENHEKKLNGFLREKVMLQMAGSDSHCFKALGYTYTSVQEKPTRENLKQELYKAKLNKTKSPFYTVLCPMINKINKACHQ